jgi:hypothetical protein
MGMAEHREEVALGTEPDELVWLHEPIGSERIAGSVRYLVHMPPRT